MQRGVNSGQHGEGPETGGFGADAHGEAAGAVFLPAVGYADSDMKTITNSTYFGRYWSATQGACLEFYSREAGRKANDLYRAISVRLVKDLN